MKTGGRADGRTGRIRSVRASGLSWAARQLVAFFALCALPGRAEAQGEGPRTYLPAPVGTNMLVPAWLSISSNFNFSQEILVEGADIQANIFVATYIRVFDIGGRLAQLWVTPIYGTVDGTVASGTSTVEVPKQTGFSDPTVVFRIGLAGAPALKPAEFAKHKQTFQAYALLGVAPPLGEYDADNPVNLGTNRWAFRAGLPLIVPIGNPARPFWLEVIPSVVAYTDNTDPQGDATLRSQDPLFLVENHLTHNFTTKVWAGLDLRGQYGGETTTDGVADDNQLRQLGGGVSAGYSISRAVAIQASYGGIIAKKGPAEGTLFRFKFVWIF